MRFSKYSILVFLAIAGVLFAIVHIFFPETKESQSQAVMNANNVRRIHGAPIIESDWIRESIGQSREKWHDGIRGIGTSQPIHLYKEIIYESDTMQVEEDAFHFEFSDSLQYRLIIYHEYSQRHERMLRTQNDLIFYHPEKFPPSHSESLSNGAADSVLRVWKISF